MTIQEHFPGQQNSVHATRHEHFSSATIRTVEQRYLTGAALQFLIASVEAGLSIAPADEIEMAKGLREQFLADTPAEIPRILSRDERVLVGQALVTLAAQEPAATIDTVIEPPPSLGELARGYRGQIAAIRYYLGKDTV